MRMIKISQFSWTKNIDTSRSIASAVQKTSFVNTFAMLKLLIITRIATTCKTSRASTIHVYALYPKMRSFEYCFDSLTLFVMDS